MKLTDPQLTRFVPSHVATVEMRHNGVSDAQMARWRPVFEKAQAALPKHITLNAKFETEKMWDKVQVEQWSWMLNNAGVGLNSRSCGCRWGPASAASRRWGRTASRWAGTARRATRRGRW